MIGFADDILGRGGRLNAALRDHYRWQAPRRPEFMEELSAMGAVLRCRNSSEGDYQFDSAQNTMPLSAMPSAIPELHLLHSC